MNADDAAQTKMQEQAAWTARAARYALYAVPKNRPFAVDLVRLAEVAPGDRVIDVASGPGVVAIEVAQVAGPSGEIVATDISPVWESYVAKGCLEAGTRNVPFIAMPGDDLGFADGSFDVALCQFGLMFMPDPTACLKEMLRVLAPGGTIGVAVWSTPDKVSHFTAMRALREVIGESEPPAGAPKTSPLSMGKPGKIEALVSGAGFTNLHVTKITHAHHGDSVEAEWQRLLEEEAFAQAISAMSPEELSRARTAVDSSLEPHRVDDHLVLPSEAIIVIAQSPV